MTDETNEITLYTFANHHPAPELEVLLRMFYRGASENMLGIMQALNTETNAEELVLVGVSLDSKGNTQCYPLATLLSKEQTPKYRSPDGKGGWFDPSAEVADAVAEETDGNRSE